jgi:hypothetical protein
MTDEQLRQLRVLSDIERHEQLLAQIDMHVA